MSTANYKNFIIPRKYKGFKCLVNNTQSTFRVYQREKIIEYNTDFINRINGHQRFFILTWCICFYKKHDYEKATLAAIAAYNLAGLPESDALDLLDTINQNKQYSKFIKYSIFQYFSKFSFRKFINSIINTLKS